METEKKANTKKRRLIGEVVKHSGLKTIKVRVETKFRHPLYEKIVKKHKNYLAHYEGNVEDLPVGTVVLIEEMPKVSKRKAWKFISKVK
ncbi:MAG: 30S ribosomal protein S17 [Candidatus Dojkabacteria bacterium]|nr:MAG: 30S ribosomal protein S17 [Candidatus Dojkabacteria bacterium]